MVDPASSLEAHRRRRHDAHLHAAETHDRAAVRHEVAADTFARNGAHESAARERRTAEAERRKAEIARGRAAAELFG